MAGPGGGPPRRSHTKSRKGCDTCKRRHIRCDENFPQCKNCTKHNCRCPYMDMPPPEERNVTPDRADLMWTPEIEQTIATWQTTGIFPFPGLGIYPQPSPASFSPEDLRLIHHVASISTELSRNDSGSFTIWTNQIPTFLRIGTTCGFVMHALLALSATHIAWRTECAVVKQMAYEHRGIALKGLHDTIGAFSRSNSDAVLAASMLLSWQASEWRGWTQLMQGTSSVIDAMQPWKHESQFGDFIAEQSTFPTAPPSPVPSKKLSQPSKQDLEALQHCFNQLIGVQQAMVQRGEDTQAVAQLINFLRGINKLSSAHNAAQRFDMLNPLRAWLFWLPINALYHQPRVSAYSLVVLAYYYTVALIVEPMFPEVGAAYFGSLSLHPTEEIARRLFSINVSQSSGDLRTPLELMEYPIDMVSQFRSRMGWQQPERTASFPTFVGNNSVYQHDMYDASPSLHGGMYALGSNPSFAYSQEHLTHYNTPPGPGPAISSLSLDPFTGASGQYLGLPTPATFNDYNNPGGSSYGGATYSDHGAEEYLYNDVPSAFEGHRSNTIRGGPHHSHSHPPSTVQTPILPSSLAQSYTPNYSATNSHYSPLPSPRQLALASQTQFHPYVPNHQHPEGNGKGKGRPQ